MLVIDKKKTVALIALALCVGVLPSAVSFAQKSNVFSHRAVARPLQTGWRYAPLTPQFGADASIAGLANVRGQLQVTVSHHAVSGNGSLITTYRTALWKEKSDSFSVPVATKDAPKGYHGLFQLVFPTTFPMHSMFNRSRLNRGQRRRHTPLSHGQKRSRSTDLGRIHRAQLPDRLIIKLSDKAVPGFGSR